MVISPSSLFPRQPGRQLQQKDALTSVDFHVRQRLPFIHGDKP